MTYTPEVGHRVRRTMIHEGIVTSVTDQCVVLDGARALLLQGTWERLSDPERDWQPGDVVQDGFGCVYIRREGDEQYPWLGGVGGGWFAEPELARPLTHLVPAP